ncbi:hypothetical protein BGZ97_007225, partial [Linnemannia gamsii]
VSTWSKLFQDSVQSHPGQPKRLQNGSALLYCNPPLANDIHFRLRIAQGSKDPEVIRVALDGLNLVQTIELCKDAFGLDLQVAQLVHSALLVAIESEASLGVPVHLESSTVCQLMALLKYYADQGGESSLKALEAVKVRFDGASPTKSPTTVRSSTRPRTAVLPDFFQLASA